MRRSQHFSTVREVLYVYVYFSTVRELLCVRYNEHLHLKYRISVDYIDRHNGWATTLSNSPINDSTMMYASTSLWKRHRTKPWHESFWTVGKSDEDFHRLGSKTKIQKTPEKDYNRQWQNICIVSDSSHSTESGRYVCCRTRKLQNTQVVLQNTQVPQTRSKGRKEILPHDLQNGCIEYCQVAGTYP